MKPEERIEQMPIDEVEQVAERYRNLSDGLITKRQAWTFFLMRVREVPVEKASELMGVTDSTVYSLSSKGGDKLMRIKLTADAMEDDHWWMYG